MREKFTFSIVARISSFFSLFISSYFVTLKFEVELIGMLSFSRSIIGLFSLLVSLGFESIYIQHAKDKNFNEYFSVLFILKSISIFANYFPLFLIIFFLDFELKEIILILLISMSISQISLIFSFHLTSKLKVFKSIIPDLLITIIESIVQIIIAFNVERINDPLILLVLSILIFSFIRFIFVIFFSRREFTFTKVNVDLLKGFIKETKPLIFMNILNVISINIGNILLAISYGYENLAYYYLINNNIITFLLLISGASKSIYMILLLPKFSENKTKEIKDIANQFEKYFSIIFMFIIVFVFLNAELLFENLLPNYVPALIFLYIMIFIPYFAGINRPYSMMLTPGRKQKQRAYYTTIKTIIFVSFQILLIPQSIFSIKLLGFGAIGLSFLITSLWGIECFIYRYFSRKYFKISSYRKIYLHIIAAFLTYTLSFVIINLFFLNFLKNSWLILIFSSLLIFGIYFFILWIFNEIQKSDLVFFLSLLNPKRYKDSLKQEFLK